ERAALPVTLRVTGPPGALTGAELRAWSGGSVLELPDSRDPTVDVTARFERRGRQRLAAASLQISDPLGLCRRRVFSSGDAVLVLPGVERVRFAEGAGADALVYGHPDRGAAEATATEVDSLRPHRPGTPAARIHWPALARTG